MRVWKIRGSFRSEWHKDAQSLHIFSNIRMVGIKLLNKIIGVARQKNGNFPLTFD